MTKQDLFTVWWIAQFFVLLLFLFMTDIGDETMHKILYADALIGNLLYLISQNLRDEPGH